jgi:succinylglutamate desuccinylase
VLFSESPTTTYSYFSSLHCGVHSFTVELGKVKPFGRNNMADFAQARTALFDLVSVESVESLSTMPVLFRIKQIILRHTEDFKFNFPDNTPNFTAFNQGDVLASEYDDQGTLLSSYSCVQDAEAIVFPNANVALGQRALLTVVPVTEKEYQFDV